MTRSDVKLYVEGGDDAHFIRHFLKKLGGRDLVVGGDIVVCDSTEKLLSRISAIAKESAPARIGLILDADDDPVGRWARIREEFAKAWGEQSLMESFLAEIRVQSQPQADLWSHALHSVETLPRPHRFEPNDSRQAEVRTWLAWQKEPGAPYGLAVSFGAFDLDHPWSVAFGGWLDRLVGLP